MKGDSSPYDGRAKYWSIRRGEYPETAKQIAKMLKWQRGKCNRCGLEFREEDLIEIDHIRPKALGGKNEYNNLQLLHRHCHDVKTREDNILISQYRNKMFKQGLEREWEKVNYRWVDDVPLVLGKSR